MVSAEWEEAATAMTGARAGVKMVGLGEAVSGIGDEAVFLPPGALYARKDDVFITINLYYADNPLDKTEPWLKRLLRNCEWTEAVSSSGSSHDKDMKIMV